MKSILKSLIALSFISSTAYAQTPKTKQIKNDSAFVKLEQKGLVKIPFDYKSKKERYRCALPPSRTQIFIDGKLVENIRLWILLRNQEAYCTAMLNPGETTGVFSLKYNLDYIRNNMRGLMSYRTDALNFFWKQF